MQAQEQRFTHRRPEQLLDSLQQAITRICHNVLVIQRDAAKPPKIASFLAAVEGTVGLYVGRRLHHRALSCVTGSSCIGADPSAEAVW